MAKVDWLGVASVLQEIGKMSEPNTLEKMQMEHELKMAQLDKKADQEVLKQQLKEQRELKKLNEKREFESLLKKVESYKGAIEGYETKISDIDKNISSMNIKGQKLNAGKGYAQIITDNDLAKKTGLQDSIVELENELGVWIDAYSEKKILENNEALKSNLYKQVANIRVEINKLSIYVNSIIFILVKYIFLIVQVIEDNIDKITII